MWLRRTAPHCLAVCALMNLGGTANAQTAPENHARIELIAEEKALQAGRPLWVGLWFQMDEGWHVYWKNSGDSGEPPKVQWILPAGFQAGAIQWPLPVRLGRGTVVDYGYENQVLLMAPITVPSDAKSSGVSAIVSDVRYLVCREICIPGKARLTLSIPVGDAASARFIKWQKLFRRTRLQLPKSAPATWKISAKSEKDQFVLSVAGAGAAKNVSFFPLEPGVIENSAPQTVMASGTGFRVTLKKSEQLDKPISALKGVIALGDGRAFEISALVAQ
ncbi:MAG: protein-disulfide reductase DsbD domain-containing protein [Candidatus Acidiferrales bacterium]